MLKLVLGLPGYGKSHYCIARAAESAAEGRRSVIVVPEQVAFTFERELVDKLPGPLGGMCEIKSFKRLCRDVMNVCGGGALQRLNEAQKIALIRRAVQLKAGELVYYRRRSRDSAFYSMLGRLFDELRNAGATPEALSEIAAGCTGLTSQKFSEIALLLGSYTELLQKSYFDDAGELYHAAKHLAYSALLKGKTVYVDGFSGFTAAEREFLSAAMTSADELVVTLSCTDEDMGGGFAMPEKTRRRLEAVCLDRFGCKPEIVVLDTQHRFKSDGIAKAQRHFASLGSVGGKAEGVYLLGGEDLYDESAATAEEILRLVREKNYSFKDICVSVRDTGRYGQAICRTFDRFGIAYIFDESETLQTAPAVVFLLCAIEQAGGIKTESLMRMLKTGICDMGEEEISLLENYAYVHSVDGADWLREFTLNPDGFGEPQSDHAREILQKTEAARQKVCSWFPDFINGAKSRFGGELLKCCWELMERCGAVEGIVAQNGAGRRDAQLAFSLIDRLYALVANEKMSREELCDTLRLLASSTKAAEIPTYADAVLIGSADRSMPYNPKAAFILGLNDSVFPKESFEGLIFTLEERELLYQNKLILAGSFEESCDMESYFLAQAVSEPCERLYLSYCSDGEPCSELVGFLASCDVQKVSRSAAFGIVNEQTARIRYADSMTDGGAVAAALMASDAASECEDVKKSLERRSFNIEDRKTALRLAGKNIRLSASKIDCYNSCPFRYFSRYLMNANPIRKAEISPSEAGNFVHEVMEKLMLAFKGDLASVDEKELISACDKTAEEYIDAYSLLHTSSDRTAALTRQLKGAIIRLALRLRQEQLQSGFRAADCELQIGGADGDIPAQLLPLDDGGNAVIEGKIDRVDLFKMGGEAYIRVVDYKTGSKEFKLSDVWQGINIQMLLYLFALKNGAGDRYGSAVLPAGVLYMPSDPAPAKNQSEAPNRYTMNGLLLEEPELLAAMEEKGEGIFIPAKLKGDSWTGKSLETADFFGKLEKHINSLVTEMAQSLQKGEIEPCPTEVGSKLACEYCDYRSVCSADRVDKRRKITTIPRSEMLGDFDEDNS